MSVINSTCQNLRRIVPARGFPCVLRNLQCIFHRNIIIITWLYSFFALSSVNFLCRLAHRLAHGECGLVFWVLYLSLLILVNHFIQFVVVLSLSRMLRVLSLFVWPFIIFIGYRLLQASTGFAFLAGYLLLFGSGADFITAFFLSLQFIYG